MQGPPGTGKSYSTAFALFARLQGAMAAGQDFRAFLSCKTHAATDVLLENVVEVREMLRGFADSQPEIFAAYFDPRLLDVPLFRVRPRGEVPAGVIAAAQETTRGSRGRRRPSNRSRRRGGAWWRRPRAASTG